MSAVMQQKRGTAANWFSANPILLAGEIGFESDTNKLKIGDGIKAWNDLDYVTSSGNESMGSVGNNGNTLYSIENATVVDSFAVSEWRSVKYVITLSKSGDNKFATTELTVLVDGTNINVSEYGTVDNNGEVGTVSVSKNGSNVEVTVTPNLLVKPITVRYYRTGLKA